MNHVRRILAFTVVAWALSGATPAPARAGSKTEAKVEFDKAEVNFKLGRFQEALEAYTRAYEIFPAAALLFDIGQCHRNLGHYDRAIFFFEGYLREENNPSRRKLALQLIADSKAEIEKQQAAVAQAPDVATPPVQTELPPPAPDVDHKALAARDLALAPVGAAPTLVTSPAAADDKQERPLTRRWWFWTAVGAGVVAAAAGAFLYYESGGTSTVLPGGSVGTLDRR
jgi:tetratricopeptide (TPR) repeat protein